MGIFDLFKRKDRSEEIQEYLKKGAVIIDVRTAGEYASGHCKDSRLITLQTLSARIQEVRDFKKPIITVCKSGGRSGQATQILKNQGLDVINGGSWQNVNQYL